ncbi:MAG TPA: YihY/virulence factor BrkB family protein [Bryobacteraceae bacterium]|nr:YihY/virulence factor BrkB family protein [Bryobacteraceae bacterium]
MRISLTGHDSTLIEPVQLQARRWRPTVRYLSQTEVHVYALAIAASVLLSFYPFLIVALTIVRDVLHFPAAENALFLSIRDYFPGDLGTFIIRNLRTNLGKANHGHFQIVSIVFLLFTANGICEPLEVALNRAWGVEKNRSYIANQVLSFFLILLCGGLFVGSVLLTTVNQQFAASEFGISAIPGWASVLSFKIAAVPVTVFGLFLIYWILPNRRVAAMRVLRVAALIGIALEGLKYLFLFAWPWLNLKLENEYGPFKFSASLIILSMVASLLVLAGAEWSARDQPAALHGETAPPPASEASDLVSVQDSDTSAR